MAFSTPIGYSLSNWNAVITASPPSDYWFFRLPHLTGNQGQNDSLGKISACGGISLHQFGSLSGSIMMTSSQRQTEFNFQYQTPLFYKQVGVSVGVQDIAGTTYDRASLVDQHASQSFFGVVTVPFKYGVYASAGVGTRRFSKGFANVSVPLGSRFKAVVEDDGLGVNEAIAWNPKALGSYKLFGRNLSTTMMLGFVDSRYYAFWSPQHRHLMG